MKIQLKRVPRQVIVITGATSGIGLATARQAVKRGASVVLNARAEEDLRTVATELAELGAQVAFFAGDVADIDIVRQLAATAILEFGRIDTWVNNAGVSIYGLLEEVSIADARRLFETNYWGMVHGSLVALKHLKVGGGALINVGSELSETVIPLQGHYNASKHALKGFTETLRIELEKEKAPVSVTLVEPSATDTPYTEHAKNYMNVEPTHQPPVYAPELVANAILHCASHPHRTVRSWRGREGVHAHREGRPRARRPHQGRDRRSRAVAPASPPVTGIPSSMRVRAISRVRGRYQGTRDAEELEHRRDAAPDPGDSRRRDDRRRDRLRNAPSSRQLTARGEWSTIRHPLPVIDFRHDAHRTTPASRDPARAAFRVGAIHRRAPAARSRRSRPRPTPTRCAARSPPSAPGGTRRSTTSTRASLPPTAASRGASASRIS